jgi:hypothetical protein
MRNLILVLCLGFLAGCNTFDLDQKWRPLEQMVERPGNDGITTTIGTKIYRSNIDAYLAANPPGSPGFDSLLTHEQVHSKRQLKMGLKKWLAKYGTDLDFMLYEEQIGYYTAMLTLRQRGRYRTPESLAHSMSKYKNLVGSMVSYEDALQWARDVYAGRWKPAEEDMWSLPAWLQN